MEKEKLFENWDKKPLIKTVGCVVCGFTKPIDIDYYEHKGFPKCCGQDMTLDYKPEIPAQTALSELINNKYAETLRNLIKEKPPIERFLYFMQMHGSSADLNFGEDNQLWECSFISSGERFTGYSKLPKLAVIDCLKKTL